MASGLKLDDAQAEGEVFGEVAALEVGYEAAGHCLHGSQDALEGLDGAQLAGKRGGIVALVIVEDGGDAALPDGQDRQQLLELAIHGDEQL